MSDPLYFSFSSEHYVWPTTSNRSHCSGDPSPNLTKVQSKNSHIYIHLCVMAALTLHNILPQRRICNSAIFRVSEEKWIMPVSLWERRRSKRNKTKYVGLKHPENDIKIGQKPNTEIIKS